MIAGHLQFKMINPKSLKALGFIALIVLAIIEIIWGFLHLKNGWTPYSLWEKIASVVSIIAGLVLLIANFTFFRRYLLK